MHLWCCVCVCVYVCVLCVCSVGLLGLVLFLFVFLRKRNSGHGIEWVGCGNIWEELEEVECMISIYYIKFLIKMSKIY